VRKGRNKIKEYKELKNKLNLTAFVNFCCKECAYMTFSVGLHLGLIRSTV
jgi:hypothetical protein